MEHVPAGRTSWEARQQSAGDGAQGGTDEQATPAPPTPRQRYIDGLRVLALVLENHPDIRLPSSTLTIHFLSGDSEAERAAMAETARAIPCDWKKHFYGGDGKPDYFDLRGELGGLEINLAAYRDAVCTRVVTGNEEREVEEVVTPAVTKKVTRKVDVVTWDCGSLLAPALPASAPAIEAPAETGEAA